MLLKDVEIKPREIPDHTYLFIRCVELEYAKAFIKRGSMKFSHPSVWCKPDSTSRGDVLESVYASQRGFNSAMDLFLKSLRKDVFTIEDRGFTFYKSKEILSYRAHCLYGLNSNNMHMRDVRSQDHRFHKAGKVTEDYFHNLFPDVNQEIIEKLEDNKKPAVLFIRPDAFVTLVKTKLLERGVREEEIMISPVSYADYYKKPFIIGKDPEELFSKHIDYKEQSEIRIVIDTRRKEVSDLFDEHGVIEIGAIDESIASISDFYFKDMTVEIRDNHLLYELPKHEEYELVDVGEAYISLLHQALCDELPDSPMSIDKIESEIEKCMSVIRGVDPNASYNRKTNILFYKGEMVDLGGSAGYKMLEHYNNYIIEGDIDGAGETIAKFKHFFPKYDMGDYFNAYYKAIAPKYS